VDYLGDDSPNSSGLDRWTFRAGTWYDQSYYSLDAGDVNGFGLGFGAEIPFSRTGQLGSGAGANIGIALGSRGSTDPGLTRELYGKLFVELAIGELWFGR
jgi:hypothetical protein